MKIFFVMVLSTMMMNHPIFMLISVMMLTLLISMNFYYCTHLSFISMIMILLILGGMLIIFMYMISLCPNKKINFNKKLAVILSLAFLMMSINPIMAKFSTMFMMKMYSMNFFNLITLMMIYLIITLIVVMKISNTKEGPLKSYN
uniref:NADH dehydrogenase subunit 6 n=1 Tax=Amblyomma papuanum TaxID=3065601 RepID=UPI0030FE8A47